MCDSYRQCVKATDADGNLANLFWELTLRLLKQFFLGTETDMVTQPVALGCGGTFQFANL